MKASKTQNHDLLHDFQSDLHAILSTLEQVRKNLRTDQGYCETVIKLASERSETLLKRWDELKLLMKEGDE